MKKVTITGISLGLAWTTFTFGAVAQDEVAARVLFDHGIDAKDRGDYLVCIGDMEGSRQKSQTLGTLFHLAECEDKAGKIASADGHFEQFISGVEALGSQKRFKYSDEIEYAKKARMRLAPNIPTLMLRLPVWAPKNVEVLHNGKVVQSAMFGIAIPIDPGEHLVTTQMPGGLVETHRFIVQQKEKRLLKLRVDVPPTLPASVPPKELSVQEVLQSFRKPGFVAVGVASAAFVTWGIAGTIALKEKSTVDEVCPKDNCIDPERQTRGREAWNRGKTAAELASVGLGLGITGAVVATAMLVMSSHRVVQALPKSSLIIAPGPTGIFIGVRGAF